MTDESDLLYEQQSLIFRLRKRAEIRRQISSRKSVQEGKPDRMSDLLEEAANEIESLQSQVCAAESKISDMGWIINPDRMGQ